MSTPSLVIQDYFPTQFGTTWEHLVQQKVSRLRETVEIDTGVVGQRKSYNQIGLSDDEEITTRNGETTDMTRLDEKRWISLKPYHTTKWFDEWDDQLLGNIVKPTSETVRSQAMAASRRFDNVIIDALGGAALTGEDGTTSTAFDAGQQIAVSVGGADSGLNLDKLIAAKSLFGVNEVSGQDGDDDPLVLVVSQAQIDDLLNNVAQVCSSDYAAVKALQVGEVNSFMGFRFVRTQLLGIDANNVRTCFAYVRSGLKLAIGQDFTTMMDILPQRNHTLQIRSKWRVGATRMEEEKVVSIACDED